MNSRDLYREVQALRCKNGASREKIAFSDYSEMIYDYTTKKLLETGYQGVLVDDLGFLFGQLDDSFHSEKEKSTFYQVYAFCLLDYYNDVSGQIALWAIEKDPVEGVSYPRFENQQFITFLQTLEGQSYEEVALWLWDVLKKVSEKRRNEGKGPIYQKERTLWNQ